MICGLILRNPCSCFQCFNDPVQGKCHWSSSSKTLGCTFYVCSSAGSVPEEEGS